MSEQPVYPYPTERRVAPAALKLILEDNGLKVSSLVLLSEGWDFLVYRMNATHILRVPKRRQVARRACNEIDFLETLRLGSSPVSVPKYDIIIESEETNGLLLGYPFIEGVPMDMPLNEKLLGKLVEPLAQLLSEVHRIDGSGTSVNVENGTNILNVQKEAAEAFVRLSPYLEIRQREIISLELEASIALDGTRALIHNDLRPDHILVGVSGIGVIDWTDIAWGYPWEDFLHLWICYGDSIIRAVAKHYNGWHPSWYKYIRTAGTWKAVLEWQYAIDTEDRQKAAMVDQFLLRISLQPDKAYTSSAYIAKHTQSEEACENSMH